MAKPKGFGNQSQTKKDKGKFSVEMVSPPVDSWCKFNVKDDLTGKSVVADFHIYGNNGKMYAEVAIPRDSYDSLRWVGANIDTISPLVCKYLLSWAQVIITED